MSKVHVISHLGLSGDSWVDNQMGHRRVWQILSSIPKFWLEKAVLSHPSSCSLPHPGNIFAGVLQSAIPLATLGHLWQGRCEPFSLPHIPNAPFPFPEVQSYWAPPQLLIFVTNSFHFIYSLQFVSKALSLWGASRFHIRMFRWK